jgi:MinD-like ATPase involved in chromosome partitioning or flagellar assembly
MLNNAKTINGGTAKSKFLANLSSILASGKDTEWSLFDLFARMLLIL